MFIWVLILILLMPFTCLSLALETYFTPSELDEMGVSLILSQSDHWKTVGSSQDDCSYLRTSLSI